jgi:hypothetical protein
VAGDDASEVRVTGGKRLDGEEECGVVEGGHPRRICRME